ncbi:hypothetical protein RRG08_005962 [Elysia crispata]|uniref:Uncharacterized protein n=1 Tax=Elysia crispata TaxID=231223 RepID=A0AAE1D2C9_9GAST|nr:hypothetical protein RRG08_005962 [Elysia crispata]
MTQASHDPSYFPHQRRLHVFFELLQVIELDTGLEQPARDRGRCKGKELHKERHQSKRSEIGGNLLNVALSYDWRVGPTKHDASIYLRQYSFEVDGLTRDPWLGSFNTDVGLSPVLVMTKSGGES